MLTRLWHGVLQRIQPPPPPLIRVEVIRDALLHNLSAYRQVYPHLIIAPVLKSNAYGHGLTLVGKIYDTQSVPFLVVDALFEARKLRSAGITSHILILDYTPANTIARFGNAHDAYVITSLPHLTEVARAVKKIRHLHLKIDTGMHRQGIMPDEIAACLPIFKENPHLILEGICTHFADADGAQPDFSHKQAATFHAAVAHLRRTYGDIPYIHLSNSAGTEYAKEGIARVGIGLYGYNPSPFARLTLQPALRVITEVTSVRDIAAGEHVGYNCTYTAATPRRIATIPMGYTEGLDRRLSNQGCVQIAGKYCPIVGRVSMNMASIDVTDAGDVHLGTPVTVISNQPGDLNTLENMAQQCNTIPYELMVHISPFLRRIVV